MHDLFFDLHPPQDTDTIPTAVDHAYIRIWRQLIKGERKPGERLTDTELAANLGLSRTPVRQALHRLAQQELVRLDPRRGFSVREFTAEDIHEIYDIRGALEALAVRLAAPRLSPQDIETQLEHLREAREVLRKTPDQRAVVLHLQTDLNMHDMLIRASGNGRLIRTLAALRSQQILFQYWDTSYPQRNEAAAEEHERILLALAAGKASEAAESMAQHIASAKERVLTDLFDTQAPGSEAGQRDGDGSKGRMA